MKYLLLLLLFFCQQLQAQPPVDLIIKNGRIINGTGNSWFYGDVVIDKGKIISVGNTNKPVSAKNIIDAKGMIVAPGFIDVHTHIEGDEVKTPTADNFIHDGVTTVVTGNCGSSEVDLKKYFKFLDSFHLSINVASLIGHNDVRRQVMGRANRDPSEDEMKKMEELVNRAMQDGAVGFSTGLIYIPGTYTKTEEIIRLAKVAANYHGLYATHMRDEADSVVFAIQEALRVGKDAGIPVEISHFKVGGQQNWGRSVQTLQLVKDARLNGQEVTIDQYPYTASSTSLSTLLPDAILADGNDSIIARLQQPAVRAGVVDYLTGRLKRRKLKHFSYAVVTSHKADTSYNGKSIEEINLMKGRKHKAKEEAQTIVDLMINGGAGMVFHGMSEDDVKRIMQYPFNMFASDASIREFNVGVPHPRGYGTNARVLSNYVRDLKVISLEEAIRRMTSLPAQKFQLTERGLIKEGMAADIVVFDEKAVKDLSTFEKPHQFSTGFYYVIVNGAVIVEDGKHTGVRSGQVLYGAGHDAGSVRALE